MSRKYAGCSVSNRRSLSGGVFTYRDGETIYSIRRGARIIELCNLFPENSVGYLGSDVANELDAPFRPIEPIQNDGNILRFAMLMNGDDERTLSQLQTQSRVLRIVTSYPVTAGRLVPQLGLRASIEVVKGSVEAELSERRLRFDGAIEQVLSGGSVRANDLRIERDNLETVNLVQIGGY